MHNIVLTKAQRTGIMERIEEHIDSTSYDWQLSTNEEHNEAITYWSDILRAIGFDKKANKLDKDYKI